MPIPKPNKGQRRDDFIANCMGNETMNKEYDRSQRYAVCMSSWSDTKKKEYSKKR
jgi:hypothetical protein